MKSKLFVATPMYGGMCHGVYTQSVLSMPGVLAQSGIEVVFSFMFNESLIQRARNGLTHLFMKSDCTHLLFMAKNIERAGDHVTNIAELISFRETGQSFTDARPKGQGAIYSTGTAS